MIRAVSFDVGETLIRPRLPVGQVYAAVAAAHGFAGLSPADLDQRFRLAFRENAGAVSTREDWARIVDHTFSGLIATPPSRTFFAELFELFASPTAWQVFDDVMPTLANLTRLGLRLGIISNWDARLRPLLDALKLAERFEVIVISCEAGHAKPAEEVFALAAARLAVPRRAILHVGDSEAADFAGARSAGFNAVLLKRNGISSANTIQSLGELIRRPEFTCK